jgi:hypothetical protein
MNLNTMATINLPYIDAGGTTSEYYYFRNFIIYYRIYISDISIQGQISLDELQTVNAGLYSDYYYLNPYTTLDNNRSPSAMGSIFSSRRFYPLATEDASIDGLLGTGILPPSGSVSPIVLDFSQQSSGTIPFLQIGASTYNLHRYYDPAVNVPWPSDRYFINSVDLQDSSKISTTDRTNMDVQNKENVSGPKYTYAAMYILLFGRNEDLTPVYSAPTFIGIFRLPD